MTRPATTPLLLLLLASACLPLRSATTTAAPTPSPTPLPVLPISNTISTLAAGAGAAQENLLKFFCKHTQFSELCLKSIHEAEPGLTTVNTATVLAALMKAVDAKTHEARAAAQKLAAGDGFDARTVELLHDCVDFYGDALDNLESAKEAIRARDAGTRDAMLSSMIGDFSTCDEGFEEVGVKSPLADWCQTLRNMTDNCLAVASLGRPQGDY